MKILFTISLTLVYLTGWCTNFYIAAAGNDGNAGTIGSPWQTTTKVNAHSFSPGDSVLFNRGDVFPGFLVPPSSGTAVSRIVFGAYGTGANPVITGLFTIPAWTNLGSNIWESTSAVSTFSMCNVVLINGVNTPMGRTPNTGYLQYQTFSTNTQITSSSLTGTPNWTGAEVVFKPQRWIIARDSITNQSGGTLTYTAGTGLPYVNGQSYNGQNNWGFFIQRDIRTVDTANEWFYNPTTKKLDVFELSTPTNVQVVTVDTVLYIVGKKYLTFDHMAFSGANFDLVYLGADSSIHIQNCQLSYSYNGVLGQNFSSHSPDFRFTNSTISNCNNDAFTISTEFKDAIITNDTVTYTGTLAGMGGSGDGQYEGINAQGDSSLIQYCVVDTTGYVAIGFKGTAINIKNNLANLYCYVKDDGGGIYTQATDVTDTISFNITINGIGTNSGTSSDGTTALSSGFGIYCDNAASSIAILNNGIANNSFAGIYLHDSHLINVRNNTVFNSTKAAILIKNDDGPDLIRNISCFQNIFFEKTNVQTNSPQNLCFNASTLHNDIASFGSFDSNYYARPVADSLVFDQEPDGSTHNLLTLAGWQAAFTSYDQHSHKSPMIVSDTNSLVFEYNPTGSPMTIPLPFSYMDVTGIIYGSAITLQPYSSAALIKNGTITQPVLLINF